MFALAETTLLALSTWGMAYWIALVVGGGLLIVAVLGGNESDLDIDVDIDVDVDFETEPDWTPDLGSNADTAPSGSTGSSLTEWLSVRFWVFFTAFFGAIGVILTHLTDLTEAVVAGSSMIAGAIAGQSVQSVMRRIRNNSGNSATESRDYVNRLARVSVAILDRKPGEVSIQVRGSQRFVPAVAPPGTTFDSGDEVIVVGYRAGLAQVIAADKQGD